MFKKTLLLAISLITSATVLSMNNTNKPAYDKYGNKIIYMANNFNPKNPNNFVDQQWAKPNEQKQVDKNYSIEGNRIVRQQPDNGDCIIN